MAYLNLAAAFGPALRSLWIGLLVLLAVVCFFVARSPKHNYFRLFWDSLRLKNYKKLKKLDAKALAPYILFCLVIASIFSVATLAIDVQWAIEDPSLRVPVITITNGQLSADVEQPYYIDAQKKYVLDTTGTVSVDDLVMEGAVLITKDQVIVKKSTYETRNYTFTEIESLVLDDAALQSMTFSLLLMLSLMMLVLFFIMMGVGFIVLNIIYALLAMVIAKVMKKKASFGELFALSILVFIPLYVVKFILTMVAYPIMSQMRFAFSLVLLILVGYILKKKY